MKTLYEPHVNLVGKVMDMQLQRQNVISGNIANVKTPRYKPRDLEFEGQLQNALGLDMKGKMTRTAGEHMPSTFDPEGFSPEWFKQFKPKTVHGEDSVNIDKEMVKMAKNNMHYSALSQVIKQNLEGVKTIIMEGQK